MCVCVCVCALCVLALTTKSGYNHICEFWARSLRAEE